MPARGMFIASVLLVLGDVQALKADETPLERVARQAKEAIAKAGTVVDHAVGDVAAIDDMVERRGVQYYKGKKLMDGIQVFRMMMCSARTDLIQHDKCMRYMLEVCATMTTGEGYCRLFFQFLKQTCRRKGEDQKEACEHCQDLGLEVKGGAEGRGSAEEKVGAEAERETVTELDKGETAEMEAETTQEGAKEAAEEKEVSKHNGTVAEEDMAEARTEETEAAQKQEAAEAKEEEVATEAKEDQAADGAAQTKDRDGDGVEDSADAFPDDPKCQEEGQEGCGDAASEGAAPAPGAPAAAPAAAEDGGGGGETDITKKLRGLPVQGYDEHSENKTVMHKDTETMTHDWQEEHGHDHKNDHEAIKNICKDNPDDDWCKRWLAKKAPSSMWR